MAVTLHPEAYRRAQEEIDRVVGRDRLPKLDDRARLPYIDALEKETFRWNNVVPMCMWSRPAAIILSSDSFNRRASRLELRRHIYGV